MSKKNNRDKVLRFINLYKCPITGRTGNTPKFRKECRGLLFSLKPMALYEDGHLPEINQRTIWCTLFQDKKGVWWAPVETEDGWKRTMIHDPVDFIQSYADKEVLDPETIH